jgi:hypothetical protein
MLQVHHSESVEVSETNPFFVLFRPVRDTALQPRTGLGPISRLISLWTTLGGKVADTISIKIHPILETPLRRSKRTALYSS